VREKSYMGWGMGSRTCIMQISMPRLNHESLVRLSEGGFLVPWQINRRGGDKVVVLLWYV
jgi:hypothetical protein